METSTREYRSRRWVGRMVRAALITVAIVLVGVWVWRRVPRPGGQITVMREPIAEAALGPGDLRIYNRDSTVDLILQGNRILAGLSPKTIAKVQADLAKPDNTKDSTGIGNLIASTVKQTVANAIGTHMAYSLADVRDMRYEDGQIIIERKAGGDTRLFGDAKVNGEEKGKLFREADAQRFIEAVRARKKASGNF